MKITPNPDCTFCHGTGTVYDSVPYGSTNVSMPSECECVEYDVECPICGGSGEVIPFLDDGLDITCKLCDGTGYISQEKYYDVMSFKNEQCQP